MDGWVRYYPPDVFPSLWERIESLIAEGSIISSEEVYTEIQKKDDGVYHWIKERKSDLLTPISETIQQLVIEILDDHPRLVDDSKNRSIADPFVIATAIETHCLVVTGERPSGNLEKPRIPDVCKTLGVRCISFLEMIRRVGVKF